MPEIHFFGFKERTGSNMRGVARWIQDKIDNPILRGVAADVLKGAVLIGHPESIVTGLNLEDEQPYILVQSSNPVESEKLVTLLAQIPGASDIVEGATLRRFVPGSKASMVG